MHSKERNLMLPICRTATVRHAPSRLNKMEVNPKVFNVVPTKASYEIVDEHVACS